MVVQLDVVARAHGFGGGTRSYKCSLGLHVPVAVRSHAPCAWVAFGKSLRFESGPLALHHCSATDDLEPGAACGVAYAGPIPPVCG